MKQIVSNYSYSPTTNVVTLTGVNIDADQLLLIVAPQVGRTLYNFASVTGTVSAGADTRVTLNASTAGLTTTSPLVIFYDDQASTQTVAGTVTANGVETQIQDALFGNDHLVNNLNEFLLLQNNVPISGTVTARLQDGSGNNLTSTSIGGVQRLNVSLASAATAGGSLPSFVNVYGGSDSGTVRALSVDSSGRTVVTGSANVLNSVTVGSIVGPAGGNCLKAISASGDAVRSLLFTKDSQSTYGELSGSGVGVFNLPVYGTVTIGSLPAISGTVTANASNGSLTTRFGTPTTANTAFATSAVTNANRKYLLIQNVTTGSNVITVGIGFTPTTTQGIQLTAGAGITFESSYIPTGQIFVLSSVTASNFTILEA